MASCGPTPGASATAADAARLRFERERRLEEERLPEERLREERLPEERLREERLREELLLREERWLCDEWRLRDERRRREDRLAGEECFSVRHDFAESNMRPGIPALLRAAGIVRPISRTRNHTPLPQAGDANALDARLKITGRTTHDISTTAPRSDASGEAMYLLITTCESHYMYCIHYYAPLLRVEQIPLPIRPYAWSNYY